MKEYCTMKIYEKIFARLNELHMSQTELSKRTGIATSTISDWRKKQINPQADKLSVICKALDMSLADLLCDKENTEQTTPTDYLIGDNYIMELFRESDAENKRRILRYFELLEICNEINDSRPAKKRQRNVSIIQDIDGNNIGDDLPSEYSGSKYTHSIKGTNAKAKANAVQGISEMIEIAVGKHFRENKESKHWRNAMYGWYRYDSRFAIPVYGQENVVERYNIFRVEINEP